MLSSVVFLTSSVFAQENEERSLGWSLHIDVRLRSEYLSDSFRIVAPATDQLKFSRTVVGARYQASDWSVEVEVQDSRAWGAEALSPIGTDDINTLEPIVAKLAKQWSLTEGSELDLSLGRMTLDYGSRRLLARNNFRNTSNAFQGAHLSYVSPSARAAVFYTLPLQRRPDGLDLESLRDKEIRLDKAGSGERFWGASIDYAVPQADATLATYVFVSALNDEPGRPVADRELATLGARFLWADGALDAEFEAAYQWGESLASIFSTPDEVLDHRAWFTHLHLGFELWPEFNFRLAYDQATGDRDPFDGRNERFDRLYGARAFELGPSGIFGAAVHSNIRAPAVRARWQSSESQAWLLSHRWLSLDSPRDFFVTGGRRDSSGASGRKIGGQWELRWRWTPKDTSFVVDLGGAYLKKGEYFSGAPGALLNPAAPKDSQYIFTQVSWSY
ncbi:alginate export family protein [Congregibacter brevis]|uniref:Alginate export family protein n=1 Tax=Congregibacter brevis TaxID=3081201 RepID=A0ABZ0IAB6_9GAMM|nr:alginate export family protein [Congregibacter sp. IMCC45268]